MYSLSSHAEELQDLAAKERELLPEEFVVVDFQVRPNVAVHEHLERALEAGLHCRGLGPHQLLLALLKGGGVGEDEREDGAGEGPGVGALGEEYDLEEEL